MGNPPKTYSTRMKGNALVVHFEKPISSTLRGHMKSFGFKCYGGDWYGSRDIENVQAFLRAWFSTHPRFTRYSSQLCWECARSGFGNVSDCSWEREFKPVDGWDAEKTTVAATFNRAGNRVETESYCVKSCPQFVRQRQSGRNHRAQ